MRSRVALALIVGIGTWLATAACELLLPTELLEPKDAAIPAPPSPPCGALPPEDPQGATGTGEILVAVRTFEFTSNDPNFGFNLDKACTCQAGGLPDSGFSQSGPPSCKPPFPGVDKTLTCDAPGGRDIGGVTGLGSSFQAALTGTTPGGSFDQRIADGLVSFLFRVRKLPEGDGSGVSVELFNASGLYKQLAQPQADGSTLEPVPPNWDGKDSWAVNCAANVSDCSSPYPLPDPTKVASFYFDHNAYVRDGQLVAHFPRLLLDFRFTDIVLTGVVLVAKLTNDSGGRGLTGQLAGRLPFHELYKSLAAVPVGGTKKGEFLCGKDPSFLSGVRPAICQNLDLRADPSTDNADPLQLCDALGIAFAFTASPAQFAFHVEPGPYLRACDGGDDPSDECTQ